MRAWYALGPRRGASDRCGGGRGGVGVVSGGRAGCGDDAGCGCRCVGVGLGVGVGGGDGGWDGGGRASAACSWSQPGVWRGPCAQRMPNAPEHSGQHVPWAYRDRREHPGVVQNPEIWRPPLEGFTGLASLGWTPTGG